MADMAPIMALAAEKNIAVIEDAAQSLGARQNDVHSGTIGTIGTYSFFPSKNLGAFGDGGLMVTADDQLATMMRKLRVHGGVQMYHHEMVGTNSRLDALQAAVLAAKLPHLDRWAEARRRNAEFYDQAFAHREEITTPATLAGNYHVFNQYTLRVQRRDELKKHLDAAGIGNSIYYPVPLHLQECFASLGGKAGDLPESARASREAISIPVFPELTAAEREQVVDSIIGFYR
jgi:dTDP-4-amino-4,6-dideoxygalactose transaminase